MEVEIKGVAGFLEGIVSRARELSDRVRLMTPGQAEVMEPVTPAAVLRERLDGFMAISSLTGQGDLSRQGKRTLYGLLKNAERTEIMDPQEIAAYLKKLDISAKNLR